MPIARCRSIGALGCAAALLTVVALGAPVGAATSGGRQPAAGWSAAVIGASVQGRAITVLGRSAAAPARHIVVIGVTHGDETAGRAVVDALLAAPLPANLQLGLVRSANPDGEALGRRTNARGVDLTRNFPFGWRPLGADPSTGPAEHPGPAPLSEPESRALHGWLRAARPDLVIWYHQPWGSVVCDDGSGWECPALAAAVGLPTERAPRPGSSADWGSTDGIPSVVVELPEAGLDAGGIAAHVQAILGLYAGVAPAARWQDRQAGVPPTAADVALTAP